MYSSYQSQQQPPHPQVQPHFMSFAQHRSSQQSSAPTQPQHFPVSTFAPFSKIGAATNDVEGFVQPSLDHYFTSSLSDQLVDSATRPWSMDVGQELHFNNRQAPGFPSLFQRKRRPSYAKSTFSIDALDVMNMSVEGLKVPAGLWEENQILISPTAVMPTIGTTTAAAAAAAAEATSTAAVTTTTKMELSTTPGMIPGSDANVMLNAEAADKNFKNSSDTPYTAVMKMADNSGKRHKGMQGAPSTDNQQSQLQGVNQENAGSLQAGRGMSETTQVLASINDDDQPTPKTESKSSFSPLTPSPSPNRSPSLSSMGVFTPELSIKSGDESMGMGVMDLQHQIHGMHLQKSQLSDMYMQEVLQSAPIAVDMPDHRHFADMMDDLPMVGGMGNRDGMGEQEFKWGSHPSFSNGAKRPKEYVAPGTKVQEESMESFGRMPRSTEMQSASPHLTQSPLLRQEPAHFYVGQQQMMQHTNQFPQQLVQAVHPQDFAMPLAVNSFRQGDIGSTTPGLPYHSSPMDMRLTCPTPPPRSQSAPINISSSMEATMHGAMSGSPTMQARPMSPSLLHLSGLADSSQKRKYRCPKEGCTKVYKNSNGLKYHLEHGNCEVDTGSSDMDSDSGMIPSHIKVTNRPYVCRVTSCRKRYKNLNGLKYHASHVHPEFDQHTLVRNSRLPDNSRQENVRKL